MTTPRANPPEIAEPLLGPSMYASRLVALMLAVMLLATLDLAAHTYADALGISKRHPLGNYIAWFFFVGMMIGEPTHMLVFPLMEGGRYHYFPGMWTSLLPMVPAAYGIWRMLADDAAAKRAALDDAPARPIAAASAAP